ncbi:DNA G/T mismatch repair endonuclease [Cenarchaeum symbiosum A]|uniref:DNA G/T mismatch repair endonuclease n=1 Tax=Cenarchaeum symbiosum (strain A) TaxID=414004 RepID=A0RY33_CENSY|nr:DNA G/T mismatch repair endonuclease [Cenarchaeum symbiosum A]
MTDVFTPEKRSWVMSRIRSKGTGIDIKMKEILTHTGIKFEMYPQIPGNPDFASRRLGITVFCDGDFWHGYDYRRGKIPKKQFWRNKIECNMERDLYVSGMLRSNGWSVLRFWEHDIDGNPDKCSGKIQRKIRERSARRGSKQSGRGSGRRAARHDSR